MFINFRVRNFRSIREEMIFSMERRGQTKDLPENSFMASGLPMKSALLKSAVIYGGNASGKSNLISAVTAMQMVILHRGVEDVEVKRWLEPFQLSESTVNEPILFEMELAVNGRHFRYGFECTRERIVTEWLYARKQRMTLMFAREGDAFVESSPDFTELTAWRKILSDTKLSLPAEALFLPTAAKMFAGGMCEAVQEWFEHKLLVLSAETYRQYLGMTFEAMKDHELSRKISMLISKADFGIQSVEIGDAHADESDMMNVWTKHVVDGKSYRFNMFRQESAGTRKVFALSAPLLDVLTHGKVLFIDELDSSLHPLLVAQLLELFHFDNPHCAQIVATAHSPSILTETTLRHDQVWFVSKNDDGNTMLASLADFKGIRGNFARIAKDYLHGCFGGVPNIRDLKVEG